MITSLPLEDPAPSSPSVSTTRTRLLTVLRTLELLVLPELLPTFLTTLTTLTLLPTDLEDLLRRLPLPATLTSTTSLPKLTLETTLLRLAPRSTTALPPLPFTTLHPVPSRPDPLLLLLTEEDLEDTPRTLDLTVQTEVTTPTRAEETEELEDLTTVEMEETEVTATEDLTAETSTTLRWANTVALLPVLRGTTNPRPLTTVDRQLTLPPLLEEETVEFTPREDLPKSDLQLLTVDQERLVLPRSHVVLLKNSSSPTFVRKMSEPVPMVPSVTSPAFVSMMSLNAEDVLQKALPRTASRSSVLHRLFA